MKYNLTEFDQILAKSANHPLKKTPVLDCKCGISQMVLSTNK